MNLSELRRPRWSRQYHEKILRRMGCENNTYPFRFVCGKWTDQQHPTTHIAIVTCSSNRKFQRNETNTFPYFQISASVSQMNKRTAEDGCVGAKSLVAVNLSFTFGFCTPIGTTYTCTTYVGTIFFSSLSLSFSLSLHLCRVERAR